MPSEASFANYYTLAPFSKEPTIQAHFQWYFSENNQTSELTFKSQPSDGEIVKKFLDNKSNNQCEAQKNYKIIVKVNDILTAYTLTFTHPILVLKVNEVKIKEKAEPKPNKSFFTKLKSFFFRTAPEKKYVREVTDKREYYVEGDGGSFADAIHSTAFKFNEKERKFSAKKNDRIIKHLKKAPGTSQQDFKSEVEAETNVLSLFKTPNPNTKNHQNYLRKEKNIQRARPPVFSEDGDSAKIVTYNWIGQPLNELLNYIHKTPLNPLKPENLKKIKQGLREPHSTQYALLSSPQGLYYFNTQSNQVIPIHKHQIITYFKAISFITQLDNENLTPSSPLNDNQKALIRELSKYIIARQKKEWEQNSCYKGFWKVAGLNAKTKISAAMAIIDALKNPDTPPTFDHLKIRALRDSELGKIIRKYEKFNTDDHDLPKAFLNAEKNNANIIQNRQMLRMR